MIIIFLLVIGEVLLGAWKLSPKIDWNATNEDNKEQNKKQMTETDIILGITHFCKENGFIENEAELEMYDPTEKDKDDLFDEVFDMECTNTMYLTRCTRCIKNCVTGEEITVVIPKYNGIYPINELDKDSFLMCYILDEFDNRFYFCYSKREIEKVELEKQIEKLKIPSYIGLRYDVYDNILHFYVEFEEVEDLIISRNELTKDKILHNIEECKKRYALKHEKSNTIRKQIQSIFNEE
jgi:hypothetical protein